MAWSELIEREKLGDRANMFIDMRLAHNAEGATVSEYLSRIQQESQ